MGTWCGIAVGERLRALVIAVVLCCVAAAFWTTRSEAAVGDLTYQGCHTGETGTGPAPGGNGACAAAGTTTAAGAGSGFNNLRSTAVSPDGAWVYGVASADSSIVMFSRDTGTGELTYRGCITGATATSACAPIPSATTDGSSSGFANPQSVAVSPDGGSVYASAPGDDSILRFGHDPGTGLLVYQGCITGERQSGPGGSGACAQIGSHQLNGTDSGLDNPQSIALTNGSLYVAATDDDAVARFSRDTGTGALNYQGCQTAETQSGPGVGTNACTLLPGAASGGADSGLDVLQTVALSPDGASLYTASQSDSAVGRFDRDLGSGALTYQGCITGEQQSGPTPPPPGSGACAEIPSATTFGDTSGMLSIYAVAVSPEGNSVYAVSENDDSIVRFDRAAGGALTYQGCITGETESGPGGSGACAQIAAAASQGTNSGLDKLRAVVPSPDGGSVYVIVPQDDAVARFARDAATGAITHAACITGEAESGPSGTNACSQIPSATAAGSNSGMDNPQSAAISPDGSSFYAGAANDAGIARFAVEMPPGGAPGEAGDTAPPDTRITKSPKRKTKKKKAKFEFTGSDARAVASFECRIDKDPFTACTAPFKDRVKKGRHHFEVRAIDAAGNVDPTPATFDWKVKKKKKKK